MRWLICLSLMIAVHQCRHLPHEERRQSKVNNQNKWVSRKRGISSSDIFHHRALNYPLIVYFGVASADEIAACSLKISQQFLCLKEEEEKVLSFFLFENVSLTNP